MSMRMPLLSLLPVLKRHSTALETLGLRVVGDILNHLPFRYEDYSRIVPITQVVPGELVTVRVKIDQIKSRRSFYGSRRVIVEALVTDGTGKAKVIWFGQHYLPKTFPAGSQVRLAGRAKRAAWGLQFTSPTIEPERDDPVHTSRIVPVYSVSGTLSVKHMRLAAERALKAVGEVPEWLPQEVVRELKLMAPHDAYRAVHFPKTMEEAERAGMRFGVEQLFLHLCSSERARRDVAAARAPVVPFPEDAVKHFVASLPFALLPGQRRAAWAAIQDMERPEPMHRLVNGDVGSGKTVVAAVLAAAVAAGGGQTALLVPTEILASQHLRAFVHWFAGGRTRLAIRTANTQQLFTGKMAVDMPKTKLARMRMVDAALEEGKVDIVIGTHALLEDTIQFADLRLAIVDEQHRFGVRQRQALHRKRTDGALPHLLTLTATPIPRTLMLTALGDLHVSVLTDQIPGRVPVTTTVGVGEAGRATADKQLAAAFRKGEQAFIVCPAIEESEEQDVTSVDHEHARIKKEHPAWRVAALHGRLSAAAKEQAMQALRDGALDAVIATTVIEVGVDIPSATLIVVHDAERFGLAQLHQLRGRVGRGTKASMCLLLTPRANPHALERLRAVADCPDGFALAERDLAIRGPGDILGTAQSGAQMQSTAQLFACPERLAVLQTAARAVFNTDNDRVRHPLLQERLAQFEAHIHFE